MRSGTPWPASPLSNRGDNAVGVSNYTKGTINVYYRKDSTGAGTTFLRDFLTNTSGFNLNINNATACNNKGR